MKKIFLVFIIVLSLNSSNSFAQRDKVESDKIKPVKLSGVRVGFTFLTQNDSKKGKAEQDEINAGLFPLITQFGWQFEQQCLCQGMSFVELEGNLGLIVVSGIKSAYFNFI